MSVKEMILDSKHECMSRDEMAALQGERLVDLVNRVYNILHKEDERIRCRTR